MPMEQAGIEVILATSKARSNMIDLGETTEDVFKRADDLVERYQKAIDGIDGKIQTTVDVNVTGTEALSGFTDIATNRTVNLDVKLGDDAGIKAVDEVPSSTTTNVDAKEGDTAGLDTINEKLDTLRQLAIIDIVLNLPGNIDNIVSTIQSIPGFGTTVDSQQAANVLAIAGNTEQLALAQELYANAWGASVEDNARLINELTKQGVATNDLADAAYSVYDAQSAIFAATGEMPETNEVIRAQASLVRNQLVPSYRDAADILAVGFQEIPNASVDLLDSVNEYASTFRNAGLSAQEMFSLFTTGAEAGVDVTDRTADIVRETGIRVRDASDTAAQDALSQLDLTDEAAAYSAGEITFGEFWRGLTTALEGVDDKQQRQALATALIGTQQEDFGLDTILNLDTVNEAFDHIENRANQASNAINDNLGTTFTELFNTVNLEAGELLSSETLDLPGKIEEARKVATTFSDALQAGETVGGALEIALNAPGLEQKLTEVESAIGNAAIAFLQAVQNLLNFAGQTDAAKAVGGAITQLSAGQLGFDLKLADNGQEVVDVIATAIERGVSTADIQAAAQTAIDEQIAAGDLTGAQATIDALTAGMTVPAEQLRTNIIGQLQGTDFGSQVQSALGIDSLSDATAEELIAGIDKVYQTYGGEGGLSAEQIALRENVGGQNNALRNTLATGDAIGGIDTSGQQAAIEIQGIVDSASGQAITSGQNLFTALEGGLNTVATAVAVQTPVIMDPLQQLGELAGTAYGGLTDGVTTLASTLTEKSPAIAGDNSAIESSIFSMKDDLKILKDIAKAYKDIADNAAAASAASGGTISGHAMGGTAHPGDVVGEAGPEIVGRRMNVLNTASSAAVFDAVYAASKYLGVGGTTNNNQSKSIVVNQYISNGAQGLMADNAVSNAYRGYPD